MNRKLFFVICLLSTITFSYSQADQIPVAKADTLVFSVLDGFAKFNRVKISDTYGRTLGFLGSSTAVGSPSVSRLNASPRDTTKGTECWLEDDDRSVRQLTALAAYLNSAAMTLGPKEVILNFDACNKLGPDSLLQVR